jgi:hypothetical protein
MCVDQARNASVSGKIDDLSAARYRRISAAANSGDNFVVSRSGEAYDARVRGPNRKFRFTTLENETAALDDFIHMFRGWGYTGSALKLECLKAGALLRGGRLDEAQAISTNSIIAGRRNSQMALCRMHIVLGADFESAKANRTKTDSVRRKFRI